MIDNYYYILMLYASDKSMTSPLAFKKERPYWQDIKKAINKSFKYGGWVRLEVLRPEDSYIKLIDMQVNPRQFRLIALTRDKDTKKELLEWWEPGDAPFRGMVRFGDDEWDARTSSSDISVAENVFHDLYESGQLSPEILQDFRSQWDPKP